ncbi:hypothetical protein [Litorimonas haliclonae]|uniref:hypothetical protein n=1 Tax=Litorimonas haliclonae TaxID=2081977 RepID=UPI0039EF465F
MSKENIIADLDYASQLAKEGAETPLLGGPIGLLWGVLLTSIFFYQWGVLSGTFGLSETSLAIAWLAFAVIGGLGSYVMGVKIDKKAGSNSAANRVESYVWTMFSGMLGTLFIGIILNMVFAEGTYKLFDLVMIVGFAGQGLAYGVVAKMSKMRMLHVASFIGFTASAVCFSFYGQPVVYLIGSIATIFTVILPSLLTMKKAGGSNA